MVFGISSGWLTNLDRAVFGGVLFKGSQVLAVIGTVGIGVMVVVNFVTVVGRRSPWAGPWLMGGIDICMILMAMVSVLGTAYCWYRGGHIRIGLFRDRLGSRMRAAWDAMASLVFLGLAASMAWSVMKLSIIDLTSGGSTLGVGIPLGPFTAVFSLLMAYFALVLLRSFLGLVAKASGRHVEHEGLY